VDAAAKTVRAWITQAGMSSIIKFLVKPLTDGKGRKELLQVLVDHLDATKEVRSGCVCLYMCVCVCVCVCVLLVSHCAK